MKSKIDLYREKIDKAAELVESPNNLPALVIMKHIDAGFNRLANQIDTTHLSDI